jgi:hypothetical protein
LKAKTVFLSGIVLALSLSIATTLPYVLAWWSFNTQSRETNVVEVSGETYTEGELNSLVNITLIAVYPKAAFEARSNMFAMHLVFIVRLDSNITEFICDEIRANFYSVNWTYGYFGWKKLSFSTGILVDFYRRDNRGEIAPFLANLSMDINSGRWPPFSQNISHLLYLTDYIETYPDVSLHARIRAINNSFGIGVLFDMKEHPTTIYRFNIPWTVRIAYGGSLFIIGAVSVNLFYRRDLDRKHGNSGTNTTKKHQHFSVLCL